MMRSLITGIFLLLLLPQTGNACQCTVLPAFNLRATEAYDVIFVGKVIAIAPGDAETESRASFRIQSLYKGETYADIEIIYKDHDDGDCALDLVPGQIWTIYGHWREFGVAYADWCEHSRMKLDAGVQDYYSIDNRGSYEDEIRLLEDSLGVKPFLDPENKKDKLHKNEIPGATQAFTYLITGLAGLAVIFWFVRRLFRKDGK